LWGVCRRRPFATPPHCCCPLVAVSGEQVGFTRCVAPPPPGRPTTRVETWLTLNRTLTRRQHRPPPPPPCTACPVTAVPSLGLRGSECASVPRNAALWEASARTEAACLMCLVWQRQQRLAMGAGGRRLYTMTLVDSPGTPSSTLIYPNLQFWSYFLSSTEGPTGAWTTPGYGWQRCTRPREVARC
jgi:hypothetical protein